jgi:pyrroline-5-carboxylate reductase
MGEISSTSVDIEKEPAHLTFIGGGHLAQALVQGIYAKSSWAGSCKISITARRSDRAQELRNTFPRAFVTVNNLHPQIWTTTKDEGASHTVIICTRPADVPGVVRQICSMLATMNRESRPTIMTMCPGIRTKQLEELLPQHTAIVRSMPNTPVACCEGATALFPNAAAADRVHPVRKVLQDVSPSVCILESESHIDVVAAIAG